MPIRGRSCSELGLEHEEKYLKELREVRGLEVVEISTLEDGRRRRLRQGRRGPGAGAIYQATFLQGQWGGRADFLIRVKTRASLDHGRMKLLRLVGKVDENRALMQLCFIQASCCNSGREPERCMSCSGEARTRRFRSVTSRSSVRSKAIFSLHWPTTHHVSRRRSHCLW